MRPVIIVKSRKDLPDACFHLLFAKMAFSWQGQLYDRTQSFKGGTIPYLDIGDWRYISQNPNKKSKWGEMARKGHKIMWIIRKSDNKWMGRMIDGNLKRIDY